MKLIKIAAGVLNQTPLDWNGNLARIERALEMARARDVSILCLPELCISGYGCEDTFYSRGVQQTSIELLREIVPRTRDMIVSVGLPLVYAGGLFNAACLIANRKIVGFVAKQHLASEGIHYEPRWFKRWPAGITAEVEIGRETYPLGDLVFRCGGVGIGFEICEDAWVGSRPGSSLAARGADVILNPSASHFAFGKHAVRRRFVEEGARAFHVSYVYANLVGNEAGRAIYDGDAMIASAGQLVAVGPRFSYHDATITAATIDVDATRMSRARAGSFEPDLDGDESDVISVDFAFPAAELDPPTASGTPWEHSPQVKFEEFTRAVAMGLFDYVRKSRSRGVVVSLSGGIDSTAVAVLSYLMLRLAGDELGVAAAAERLLGDAAVPVLSGRTDGANIPAGGRSARKHLVAAHAIAAGGSAGSRGQPPARVAEASSDETTELARLARHMITTVYQATRNSSQATRQAARTVAEAIGSAHYEFDVDSLVSQYTEMVSGALGRPLTWETDDVALQNIQARARSPGAWMLANINQALLLSTSNRSEAAVGYATMDGDTSGGLAPLAGIDKAFLRRWLKWIELSGPQGLGPLTSVAPVNDLAPTAELRPADRNQTDEGDLMPYDVLDAIERLAIRDKLFPMEVFRHVVARYPDIPSRQLGQWTIRFFQLWCRNQWKRAVISSG